MEEINLNVKKILSNLINTGSKELREYLQEKYEYSLNPVIIRNIYNSEEI